VPTGVLFRFELERRRAESLRPSMGLLRLLRLVRERLRRWPMAGSASARGEEKRADLGRLAVSVPGCGVDVFLTKGLLRELRAKGRPLGAGAGALMVVVVVLIVMGQVRRIICLTLYGAKSAKDDRQKPRGERGCWTGRDRWNQNTLQYLCTRMHGQPGLRVSLGESWWLLAAHMHDGCMRTARGKQ